VTRVLPELESVEVPVYLAYPEELRHSKRIDAFRDFVLSEIIEHRRKLRDASQ
ncbi:MAG: LysR family transcriptional regulator, partial [Paracoccaceae bacterium]